MREKDLTAQFFLTVIVRAAQATKTDNFFEKFQTLTPSLSFSENNVAFFFGKRPKKNPYSGPKSAT